MPETVARCPLCEAEDHVLFDRRVFRGQTVENRLCRRCGFVFQSPRMTEAEAAAYYAAEYRRMYQGDEGPGQKDLTVQRQRAASLVSFLRTHGVAARRHLDIGASAGLLLGAVREALGAEPVGVEPGRAYREFAQAGGLRMYARLEDLMAGQPGRFDLISMAHVLEHLPDPVGYLRLLRETLLAPDGWLLIEVPNLFCHDSFEVAHLTAFSAHTLRQALEKAGYEVVALEAHGRPRSDVLPLYLTALAKPTQRAFAFAPERGVALKRRLGLLRRALLLRLMPGRAWSGEERRRMEINGDMPG